MPIRHWQEIAFYDPMNDCQAVRISGFSGHGEYWISEALTLPGKSRRAQREAALDRIEAAIERGDEPGEVRADTEAEQAVVDPVFDPTIY